MVGSYFGHVVLFIMSCTGVDLFDGYAGTDERMQDDWDFMSHLEVDTPDLDDKDCCPYDCASDLGCDWNDFNSLSHDTLSKLSNFNELASRPLTAPPCSTEALKWIVESTEDVQALAEAVNCSDGAFDVEWVGSIVVEKTILVVNGTVLNITGIGPIAAVDGGGATNLFVVSNASLYVSNINVTNGNATYGGAIVASRSKLIFNRMMFFDNTAAVAGGALFVSNNSTISISGDSSFFNNHANDSGGAVYVRHGCSMLWAGEINFFGNTASVSGGAVYISPLSNASWEGGANFTGNTASKNGGAIYMDDDSSLSWSGHTIFSGNMAGGNGGAVACHSGSYLSWQGNITYFSGNTGFDGGAILMHGSVSWTSQTYFFSNAATGNGGALIVREGGLASWSGETTFYDNSAVNGGALRILSGSDVRYSGDTSFINNSANSNGGAIRVDGESNLSWSGHTNFSGNMAGGNGGAVACHSGSYLSWQGNITYFFGNTGFDGGAIMMHGSVSWTSQTYFFGNTATGNGGALIVRKGGLASWSGETTFYDNSAVYGGALRILSGSDVLYSGGTSFINNSANSSGGAIRVDGESNLSWSGYTVFSDNTAVWSGGAVACYGGSYLSWQGNSTYFSGNTGHHAGALRVGDGTNVFWTSQTYFFGNTATGNGGALIVRKGGLASWSGETTFYDNSAQHGGALFISEGVNVQWSGNTHFRSNHASLDGGAMAYVFTSPTVSESFSDSDSFIVINATTTVANNTCGGNGGGIALKASLSLEIYTSNLTFDGNYAAVAGGGVYISVSEIAPVFEGTKFTKNSANLGGGIYSTVIGSEDHPLTFDKCSFVDNTAEASGGAMSTLSGYYSFIDTSFLGNAAAVGGALRLGGVAGIENCTFVENVSGNNEGPAVSNIGVLSNLTKNYFRDNLFRCDAGMYLELVEGNPFHVVCDGCDFVSCDECSMEVQLTPKCTSAMEHSTSTGGVVTIEYLEIDGGYWRASTLSTTILACYNPDACIGGITGALTYCMDGYRGPYCSVCSQGYMSNQGCSCSRCSNNARNIVSTVLLAVTGVAVVVVITLYLVSPDMEGTRRGVLRRVAHFVPVKSLKIVINAWQIVTQFSAVASVTFPGVYQRFLDGVTSLNFDLTWILSVGCIVDVDFHDQLIISTLGPIVVIGFLGMKYAAAARRYQGSEEALQSIRYKNASMALLLTFLIYSNVSATVFQMFACDDLDDGNTYLRADYRIQCDSTRHRLFQIYAGFMVIIYPIGIPALYAVLLFRSRGLLKDEVMRAHSLDVKSTSDLWKPYKPSRFYYEVIECGRRIALTGVVVFIYPNTAAQIAVALLMSFAFTVISECLDPYESRWHGWLNRTGNLVVFASMFLALALKVDISDENAKSQKVFEAVFVAVNGCMITLVVVEAVATACALTIKEQNEPKPRFRVGRSFPTSRVTPTYAGAPTSTQIFDPLDDAGNDDGETIHQLDSGARSLKNDMAVEPPDPALSRNRSGVFL